MRADHIIKSYPCKDGFAGDWCTAKVLLDSNEIMFLGSKQDSQKYTTYAKFKVLSRDKVEVVITKQSEANPSGMRTGHKFMYESPKFLELINKWDEYLESLLLEE